MPRRLGARALARVQGKTVATKKLRAHEGGANTAITKLWRIICAACSKHGTKQVLRTPVVSSPGLMLEHCWCAHVQGPLVCALGLHQRADVICPSSLYDLLDAIAAERREFNAAGRSLSRGVKAQGGRLEVQATPSPLQLALHCVCVVMHGSRAASWGSLCLMVRDCQRLKSPFKAKARLHQHVRPDKRHWLAW